MAKIDLNLLDACGDFLDVQDMLDIFGVSRATLYKHETLAIDGFPRSANLLGTKCWPKAAVKDYVNRQLQRAERYTALVKE